MDLGLEDEILRGPECDVNHLVSDEINNLLFERQEGGNRELTKSHVWTSM